MERRHRGEHRDGDRSGNDLEGSAFEFQRIRAGECWDELAWDVAG